MAPTTRRKHHTHQTIDTDTKALTKTNWAELAEQLHAAIDIELNHPSTPGYPTHVIGAGPPTGPTNTEIDIVELTTVEAAADYNKRHKDEYAKLIAKATRYHEDIHANLRACTNMLEKITALRGGTPPTGPTCQAMARIGITDRAAHTPMIDGKPTPLGAWAYKFYNTHHRLPTVDECHKHNDPRITRVMVRQ